MGSFTYLILCFSILAAITLKSNSQYLLPITKHEPTNQFYTTLNVGSPTVSPQNLLLDLATNLTWLDCRRLISLSSQHLVTCESSTCKSVPGTGCNGRSSCLYKQPTPLGRNPLVTGRVVQDIVSISTTDGGRFLSPVSLPRFTFSCAGEKALQGFPPPVAGVLALSLGSSSFPRQVTSAFDLISYFSLCLPSSGTGTGHFYIATPHYLIPPLNGSDNPRIMTDLIVVNSEYLLYVTSIYVGGVRLSLSPNLLEGGAKLSTVVPYTVLHTDIYNALAQSFTVKAKTMGISKVQAIAPFKDCFDARAVGMDPTGLSVPVIEIRVPSVVTDAKWTFYGANTVVKVTETVMCLAFLDGGKNPKDLMVVGTHQLQDYMLEFHFSSSTTLAFGESLLLRNTSCSTWPSQKYN